MWNIFSYNISIEKCGLCIYRIAFLSKIISLSLKTVKAYWKYLPWDDFEEEFDKLNAIYLSNRQKQRKPSWALNHKNIQKLCEIKKWNNYWKNCRKYFITWKIQWVYHKGVPSINQRIAERLIRVWMYWRWSFHASAKSEKEWSLRDCCEGS